jgi:hypothetical protein
MSDRRRTRYLGSVVAVGALLAVLTASAGATPVRHQAARLVPGDLSGHDFFGTSVAISGTTAVVGAPEQNSARGAAYVFVRNAPGQWTKQAKLTSPAPQTNDFFGDSVAISGSTIVVGADGNLAAAYVFVRSGTTWTLQQKLTPADGTTGQDFGASVAIGGNTAVVGAPTANIDSSFGAAYVFVRSGTRWTQQAWLQDPDPQDEDLFGSSVGLSGSTAVIGTPNVFANGVTGKTYVYVRTGSAWAEQAKLLAADGAPSDIFGSAVTISGDTVAVGAPDHDSFRGATYVFERAGTSWTQQAELAPAEPSHDFGFSVALGTTRLLVGSPHDNAVYAFTGSGATWSEDLLLTASNGNPNDAFGAAVALSHGRAVVGAPDRGNTSNGAAYVFSAG